MTPTRDHLNIGPQIDTGTGSPVAERPDTWAYGGPAGSAAFDTGTASLAAKRPDTLDTSNAFIPPLWL